MASVQAVRPRARWLGQTERVALVAIFALLGHRWIQRAFQSEALQNWVTMFVAIVVQSAPFLVGGVLLSASISRYLSEGVLRRVMPGNPVLAVPVAGLAGVCLPGCECAAVPVTDGLMRRGLAPAAALTFLLAAPAINPAVIVSTAVAFPHNHAMVVARVLASFATAVLVGWWALARGDRLRLEQALARHDHDGTFLSTALHDFLHAGGFLIIGAMAAAAINTFLPRHVLDAVGGHPVWGILALAAFAFVVALCSESDAFVASSLTSFSDTAKLTFLVVGPAMDIKLAAMEAGQFGTGFARQFVPIVLITAVASAVLIGSVLL